MPKDITNADRDYTDDFRRIGLAEAGLYQASHFSIPPPWKTKGVVYVWALMDGTLRRPVRVGKACGAGGLGGRHTLHSRWLQGLFKPADRREQEIARLTRHRLGETAEVWAIEVRGHEHARSVEKGLVALWRPLLDLDLTLNDSWLKMHMNEWRRSGRGQAG